MRIANIGLPIWGLAVTLFAGMAGATELPDNFPDDVPIGDNMEVAGVTVVGADMIVDLHAPGQTLAAVVDWFQAGLTSAGWQPDGQTINERKAILAFSKNGRRCGVSVTNFVLNSSMQMDDSIKGITLQLSANRDDDAASAEAVSETAVSAEQQ